MNLDQEEKKNSTAEEVPTKKNLTRKEKKALKKAEQAAAEPVNEAPQKTAKPVSADKVEAPEEVEAKLDPAPVPEVPPPRYTTWEKISPPARRKKQIANMESGFREVLGLVQSMRNNQEVLLNAFQKLPEAVDSVKKLADHSALQSDLLKAMNEQMTSGPAGDFNKTLNSMDHTTQLLLERAQRSEERLYGMLRQAQRRIAFMTLLVLLLFVGALASVMVVVFPEQTQRFLNSFKGTESVSTGNAETPSEPAALPEAVETVISSAETTQEDVKEILPEAVPEISETIEAAIPETETISPDSMEAEPLPEVGTEIEPESAPEIIEDVPSAASEAESAGDTGVPQNEEI
ncbi:MAG: hypothetical protein ACO3N7_04920 [Kiritimatiellia bacterium]